jgi:hypothetical protein
MRRPPVCRDGSACMRGQAQLMWRCLCCMLPAGSSPEAAWRWQVGAKAECDGCCLGGGRLEQRLNAADASLGGGRLGQNLKQSNAAAAKQCRCPLLQPIPQMCLYGPTVRILCKEVP